MPDKKTRSEISGEGKASYEDDFRIMGEIIQRDADRIMEQWLDRATREQVYADPAHRKEAMNDLLHMLQSLGRTLQDRSSDALEATTRIAREHGQQRSAVGWRIVHVARDYEILHGVALQHLAEVLSERLTYRQAMILASVVARAIGSAVEAFSEATRERLEQANNDLEEHVRNQQAELRQLTLDLTDAQHRERQQMAQVLHDDLQQILMATRMKLDACLRSSPPTLSTVEEARQLVNHALEVSRNVTSDLNPMVLEHQSLPTAIQWLGDTFQNRYGLRVAVELPSSPQGKPMPMSLRRLVYDAVRELLFNVVKHGQTDQAWVRIRRESGALWRFEIEDRGAGSSDLDKDGVQTGKTSRGLATVRRRIKEIGGTMEVDSKPGQGTRVVLFVPVE